jgi:M6 family metalloprotease-like protein
MTGLLWGQDRENRIRAWNQRSGVSRLEELAERARELRELMRENPAAALGAALPERAAEQLRRQRPAAAEFVESWGEWEDEAERTVAENFETGESREVLRVGGQEVNLVDPPLTLQCGDRLRVRGVKLGEEVAARLMELAPGPRGASACSNSGEQRVAVILLQFPGQSLPANVSAANLRTAMTAVDTHWREASYGLTTGNSDVLGPFTLSQAYTCSQTDQIRTAGIAAADSSVDLRQYTRLVFVFPGNCGGLGTIGCRNNTSPTRGSFTASVAWLGQDFSGTVGLASCAIVHEIGHGMGLSHASTVRYGTQVLGGLNEAGTNDEYGDRYSLMGLCYGTGGGNYLMGHFAAPHKRTLGWLEGTKFQQVESSGTFTLAPYALNTTALQAIRVRRGVGNDRWLWLEYRQPIGQDATLLNFSTQFDDGALGHYENPAESSYGSYTRLVHFRASTNPSNFTQPALAAGQTWTDPFSELSLQVTAASSSGMTVRVTYDTPCATLGPANAAVGAAAGTSTVQVTAPAGCAWAVASNDSWLTVTSASSGSGNGTVSYSYAANTAATARTGTISIGRQGYNITQQSANNQPAATGVGPAASTLAVSTYSVFEAVFTDLDGATTLNTVNLWFTAGSEQGNACRVEYRRGTNELRLYGDSNSGWQFTTPGANTTMSNSQCQVGVQGSSAVVSGTTLRLRVNVRFLAAFAGLRNIYGSASDSLGASSGATLLGTVNVGTVNLVPAVGGVSPVGGSGGSRVMTFAFTDGNGGADLNVVNVLINGGLDGSNSCYLAYVRSANTLYLMNDAGTELLPGMVLSGSGSLANSRCSVAGAGSSATVSGTALTLVLNLSFTGAHGGNRVVYAAARDMAGGNSGWKAVGVWQVPGPPATSTAVGPVLGNAISGTSGALTATFTDSNGFADLNVVNVLINTGLDGGGACYLAYVRSANAIYLVTDAGDGLLPEVTPGTGGMAANSQCSVLGSGSSVSATGNSLTLTLNLSMSSPAFRGARIIYAAARDLAGNNSGWQAIGTWTVP